MTRFKNMVTVPWSDEVIVKMIVKHGLNASVNLALDGKQPDVELPPHDEVVVIDDIASQPSSQEVVKDSNPPIIESAPTLTLDPPNEAVLANEASSDLPKTPTSQDIDDEEVWISELRRSVRKKPLEISPNLADMDDAFPDSQPMENTAVELDDALEPDPVFSRRMTVLYDSDSEAPPSPTSTAMNNHQSSINPKKRPHQDDPANETLSTPKRSAPASNFINEQTSSPPGPPFSSQSSIPSLPDPQSPVSSQRSTQLSQSVADDEKTFIKSLGLPSQLSDFPPHDYRRMQALNVQVSGKEGIELGNLDMWNKLCLNQQLIKGGREKPELQRLAEILMVVDIDFAYSKYGAPVMDLLEGSDFNIRLVAARLPCRNTIIFRRIGHEFALNSQVPISGVEEGARKDTEKGYMFATQVSDANGDLSQPPLSAFTVDMDEILVLMTPLQWSRPHFSNLESSYLMDIQALNPHKSISVLILHPAKLFTIPRLSTQDIGKFMPEMMFEYDLSTIYTSDRRDSLQIATILYHIHRALANRAYQFPSLDGPYRTLPHFNDSRVPEREPIDAFIAMIVAVGIPHHLASLIAQRFPSPLDLYEELEACKDEETAMDLVRTQMKDFKTLDDLTSSYSTKDQSKITKAHSKAIWMAFSSQSSKVTPYEKILPL